jgi:methionine aminopeptidase
MWVGLMHQSYRNVFLLLLGLLLLSSMNTQVCSNLEIGCNLAPSESIISSSEDAILASSISSIAVQSARNILRQTYDREITQLEITNHLDSIMRAEGSDAELSFPSLVMTQDEFDWPYGHSNDDAEHVIDPTQEPVVTIRVGARVNGQCVDVYRTFFFESVTQEIIDAYSTVLDTQQAVIDAISPGVSVSSLDTIVQIGLNSYIGATNFSYSYYWGHGVGEFAIVEPLLSNVTEPMELIEGQIFTVQIWLYNTNGWFVRLEDTILVTTTGCEVLSDAPKQIDEITILPVSPRVDADVSTYDYDYGHDTIVNLSLLDTANRTINQVSFFDGNSWVGMQKQSATNFSRTYHLDYSYASFIRSILRIELSNETVYIIHELNCDPDTESVYEEIFDPAINIVVEQVTIDDPYRWVFTKVDAEMLRINFYQVYPPPGDQFLVKDGQENVVYEYKWDLGHSAISPWVPGNILIIEITSTWSSEFGGINHFFFTVDMMWVLDTDYTPTTTDTTTSSSTVTSTPVTTTDHTVTTTDIPLMLDPVWVIIGGFFCVGAGIIGVIMRRR